MSIQAGNACAASQRTGSSVRCRARGLAFDRSGSAAEGECAGHSRSIRFPFGARGTANWVAMRHGSGGLSMVRVAVAADDLLPRTARVDPAAPRVDRRVIRSKRRRRPRKKSDPARGGVTGVAGRLGFEPARQVAVSHLFCGSLFRLTPLFTPEIAALERDISGPCWSRTSVTYESKQQRRHFGGSHLLNFQSVRESGQVRYGDQVRNTQ